MDQTNSDANKQLIFYYDRVTAFNQAARAAAIEAHLAAHLLQDMSRNFYRNGQLIDLFGIDLLEPYRRRAARRAQLALAAATIGATIAIAILAQG